MTSEGIDQLATALAAAQVEMTNAPFNRTNPHFKSKYADLAAIREATLPALNKHGLAVVQTTNISEAGLTLITRIIHKSGQWISSEYPLPLDLGKPQVMGSALTYARRYAWAAACGITADDDDDAETASKARVNGNGAHRNGDGELVSKAQLAELEKAVEAADADAGLFIAYINKSRQLDLKTLGDLPAHLFEEAREALGAKAKRK